MSEERRHRTAETCFRLLVGAVLAYVVLLAPGCGSRRPNVILYVADTLRADAIGPYGNTIVDTPALDRLAREGIVFENVYAPSPWTRPSIASILTGIHPTRHGVETRFDGLTDAALQLSEAFRAGGYTTGAVVANPNIASFFGFSQGFEVFRELYERRGVGFVMSEELAADSAEVTEQAIRWIDSASRPFFLFVLAIDAHWPYQPPKRFDRYGGDYQGPITGAEFVLRASDLSEADQARMKSLYLGEVAFLDDSFGGLLKHLRERNIDGETIVAFTSDHGEEFWEHGIRGHGGTVFEKAVRVPLIIRDPRERVRGARIRRTVYSIDIFPTLLEMAGLPLPDAVDGKSAFEAPEREGYFSVNLDGTKLKALTRYPWKMIWDQTSDRQKLFDLESDPDEQTNLLEIHPEQARSLAAELSSRAREPQPDRDRLARVALVVDSTPPAPVLEGLKALGYVVGDQVTASAQQKGLIGAYHANADWTGDPVLRRIDPRLDFDWQEPPWPLPPPFSIEWTGELEIERNGRYSFALESDDGSILEIDDQVVVDNGGEHALRTRSGSVELSEGTHHVRIRYCNELLGGVMRWRWQPPGAAERPVPEQVLTPGTSESVQQPPNP